MTTERFEIVSGARAAARQRGRGKSAFYNDIANGLMTRPFANGPRARCWPAYEIDAINRARAAGADDQAIRALVDKLHNARRLAAAPESVAPKAAAQAAIPAPAQAATSGKRATRRPNASSSNSGA